MPHTEQQDKVYHDVLALYDYAEKVLDVVEEHANDVDADLDLVEPLIEQLVESADMLAEAFRHYVETGKQPDPAQKQQVEKALERIYEAMEMCKNKIGS